MRYPLKFRWLLLAVLSGLLVFPVAFKVNFNIKGHFEGLYLLHRYHSETYEITDDLFVGQSERLIAAIDLSSLSFRGLRDLLDHPGAETVHLHYEWDPKTGCGYVKNFLGNGRDITTYLGRFEDEGEIVRGVFVGGGPPSVAAALQNHPYNNSGMTYFDGARWNHLWCNVNELVASGDTTMAVNPSQWRFLGSRVEESSRQRLTVTSSHEVRIDNFLLRIDRRGQFVAGATYMLLDVRVTNSGTTPAVYFYAYGDEPWVGEYGSSRGDVGWVQDRLIYSEEAIDPVRYSYAGMFDYGNSLIGEGHTFTTTANFIEWGGKELPTVYFSNTVGRIAPPQERMPLSGNRRFIGLEWGPRVLAPGESATYSLAIGMAAHDPSRGVPIKPPTGLHHQ
ncbi:MAG TPA: hypothetical protein VFF53_12555 [Geobacteraceae bacterium]|nr:hypothetical protein [Geobacteraceae bacterium]